MKNIFYIISLLILYSCNNQPKQNSVVFKTKEINNNITIIIQPFSDFPNKDLLNIEKEIKKYYPHISLNKPIDLPKNCLNKTKTRYRADSLINFLNNNTNNGSVTIGVTTKDISTTKGKISDWGIFGLGFCPGRSCIVSTFRIKGKSKSEKFEKLVKVTVHELGHTQGLKHCAENTCLMRDAKGKDRLNEEKEFCVNCKSELIKKGWKLI